MSCTLSKFKVYNLNHVRHDKGTGSYSVEIANPPAACPEGVFSSKNATLIVNRGLSPSISFDLTHNRPIISVPTDGFVVEYGSSFGFVDFLLIGGGAIALILAARWAYRKLTENSNPTPAYSPYTPSYAGSSSGAGYAPSAGGSQPTTVVNNVNSGPDLLTTMLVADALSSHNHGGNNTTTIIERERVVERESSDDDSDDDSSSSSSSSDDSYSSSSSDDSYSSSSSDDSYSSDSSSSDSYDSGSSDSGSFSSD